MKLCGKFFYRGVTYQASPIMGFRVNELNATFNNILVISWRSVSLMEETGVHGGNHIPVWIVVPYMHTSLLEILLNRQIVSVE